MHLATIALIVLGVIMPDAVWSEIIHFRPDEPLFAGWGLDYPPDRPDDSLDIDLNFDGILDINFKGEINRSFMSYTYGNTLVFGQLPASSLGGVYQIPLNEGDYIAEESSYDSLWDTRAVGWGTSDEGNLFNSYLAVGDQILGIGNWGDDTVVGGSSDGYLGVQFEIDGNSHYGWVYIRSGANQGWIDEWAYESIPTAGIIAGAIPEPSTVLLFAVGALGVWTMRKKKIR